jgi:pheromone shutdown protein TraB
MLYRIIRLLLVIAAAILIAVNASYASEPEWVQAMRDVHAKNQGEKGILVQLGDSLTYSMAFSLLCSTHEKQKCLLSRVKRWMWSTTI